MPERAIEGVVSTPHQNFSSNKFSSLMYVE